MTPSYSIRALARADLEEIWFFTFIDIIGIPHQNMDVISHL